MQFGLTMATTYAACCLAALTALLSRLLHNAVLKLLTEYFVQ